MCDSLTLNLVCTTCFINCHDVIQLVVRQSDLLTLLQDKIIQNKIQVSFSPLNTLFNFHLNSFSPLKINLIYIVQHKIIQHISRVFIADFLEAEYSTQHRVSFYLMKNILP